MTAKATVQHRQAFYRLNELKEKKDSVQQPVSEQSYLQKSEYQNLQKLAWTNLKVAGLQWHVCSHYCAQKNWPLENTKQSQISQI